MVIFLSQTESTTKHFLEKKHCIYIYIYVCVCVCVYEPCSASLWNNVELVMNAESG
jgi:hypothetical protein